MTTKKMNSIDIKEAVKATGKSDKTMRRFFAKAESKPFVENKGGKLFIDVNYLFDSYPPVKGVQKSTTQRVDSDQSLSKDKELAELKAKLALYEQEIRHKDDLLNEKDGRIVDLQKAMLLLEAPKEPKELKQKKKPWWKL